MVKVRDIMDVRPVTVSPSMSVLDVAKKMKEKNVDFVFVSENGSLRGKVDWKCIVTDVIVSGQNPKRHEAKEIMNEKGPQVSAGADIMEAAKIMARHHTDYLPVIQNGKLVGCLALEHITNESLATASLVLAKMHEPDRVSPALAMVR